MSTSNSGMFVPLDASTMEVHADSRNDLPVVLPVHVLFTRPLEQRTIFLTKAIDYLPRVARGIWQMQNILDIVKQPWQGPAENGTERRPVPKAVFWKPTIHKPEALLDRNIRNPVPSQEVAPYGDSRSIVKIRATFPDGETFEGSAVVIIGHTVLTACHNIYNEEHGGPAQIITVIAGVDGTSGSPEVQHGKYAVAHYSWCANSAEKNDLGLVRLEKPFTTLEPKEYRQNLYSEKGKVYGYSGDIPVFAKGTQLYVSSSLATYHPCDTAGSVEHEADTFNGNSGGPILGEDGKVFAIHRGSGHNRSGKKINQAVAINREGNDVADFVAVLDQIDTNGFDGSGLGDSLLVAGTALRWS